MLESGQSYGNKWRKMRGARALSGGVRTSEKEVMIRLRD